MTQYIDKAAVMAEIDKRITSLEGIGSENYLHDNYPEQYAMLITLKSLKFSLDTLEVKEVDLKEKAVQLSQKYFPNEENIWARANIEAQKCKSACIEMVEWLKAQKGE